MKTDNELIAEFLGWPLCDCGNETPHYKYGQANWETWFVPQLKFHTSWDWLMPAVKKAHEICSNKQQEFRDNDSDLDDVKGWRAWSYRHVSLSTNIEEVFEEIIEFIKWYNAIPR